MPINQTIYEAIKANNNVITTSEVEALGFSRMILSKYVKEGLLKRCRQGTYMLPDEAEDDMYILMMRSDKIIFSHETALFLNGLSDRTPFIHSVTIPSDTTLPSSAMTDCNCFYVKRELHTLGVVEKRNTFGNVVKTYDAERTVCDLLRSRSRVDEETVIAAVKNYAVEENKDLNRLLEYAKAFHVQKQIRSYMEVLL